MNLRLVISLAILLFVAGCARRGQISLDLTHSPASELQQHIGENVTLQGRFSLYGKIAPFIQVGANPVYLVPQGSFSWGEPYASMEGREVRMTGMLKFAHYPQPQSDASRAGRPSDHFYFEAETTKVELIQR
jgi:hypothetical protein